MRCFCCSKLFLRALFVYAVYCLVHRYVYPPKTFGNLTTQLPRAHCMSVNMTETEKYDNIVHNLKFNVRKHGLLGLSAHHLNFPVCIMVLNVDGNLKTFFNPSVTLLEKYETEIAMQFGQTPWFELLQTKKICEEQTVSLIIEENDITCADSVSSFRRRFCQVRVYADSVAKKREVSKLHGAVAFVAQNLYDTMMGYSPCLFTVDERF